MISAAAHSVYQSGTFAGRYRAPLNDDDPWEALHQNNRAELKLVRNPEFAAPPMDCGAICVGSSDSYDALQSVNLALTQAPERGDYWMMRFELLRSLQRKDEFGDALQIAWRNPVLVRRLDGRALRFMWRELAHWEPLPDGVSLPAEDGAGTTVADRSARQLRFNELAQRLAAGPLADLRKAYAALRQHPLFHRAFARRMAPLLQRPTPLQFAVHLSSEVGFRTRVFLKREDVRAVTPHAENAAAQAHLAASLGHSEIIAGNDQDEHSIALATVAPHFGLQCTIVMADGEEQAKIKLSQMLRDLGAQVLSSRGLPMETDDPREAALRLWRQRPRDAHLALLTGPGPEPYQTMTADFRAILGHETELQLRAHLSVGRPRAFIAARYSKADGIGLMLPQVPRDGTALVYVEPDAASAARSPPETTLAAYNGAPYLHAQLRGAGRAMYVTVTDDSARRAQDRVFRLEGVELSLEDARAVAFAWVMAATSATERDIVVLAA